MKQTKDATSQKQRDLTRRNWGTSSQWMEHPFTMMRRLSSEMDHLLSELSGGGGLFGARFRDLKPNALTIRANLHL